MEQQQQLKIESMQLLVEENNKKISICETHCNKLKDNLNKLHEICIKNQTENNQLRKILGEEVSKSKQNVSQTLLSTEEPSKQREEVLRVDVKEGTVKKENLIIKIVPIVKKEGGKVYTRQSSLCKKLIEKIPTHRRCNKETANTKKLNITSRGYKFSNKENKINDANVVKEIRLQSSSRTLPLIIIENKIRIGHTNITPLIEKIKAKVISNTNT